MMNITIVLYDNLNIQFECDDYSFLRALKEHFTDYATGYMFSPKWKAGMWDGKISVFNWTHKTLPYGLLLESIRFIKKEYPDAILSVNGNVSSLFKGNTISPDYDLKLKPRPYQADCIESALKYSKGLIVSSVASGKSLLIAYIIKHLLDNGICKKALIIVPTIQLVSQFYTDLQEYGLTHYGVGRVWAKEKQFDSSIIISTWQSISKYPEILATIDCVVCDEAHMSQARVISDTLQHCTRAIYRLGFTGTLSPSKLDTWNVQSYLGPVIRTYGAGELSDLGYVSKCNVEMFSIEYNNEFEGTYTEIQDAVFNNSYRLGLIADIVEKADGNVLLLVGKVEKEGMVLRDYLHNHLSGREVVFIHGATEKDVREAWRKDMDRRKDIVLIATYQLLSVGINIPSLKHLVLAAPFKSKIRVLQSVGRTLRLHADKPEGAYVYDLLDETKHFFESGTKRMRYYASERFNVVEHEMKEGQPFLDYPSTT